jgi:hypothetical protein
LRLAAGVLVEINDEWLVAHRYLSQVSMALLSPNDHGPAGPSAPARQRWRARWPAPESPPPKGT